LAAKNSEVMVVIPARQASVRFPGKPLAQIAGKSMIQRVYEQARKAESVSQVMVATDDEKILQAVKDFGGEAMMTRHDHHCGMERVAEVAAHVPAEIYVDLQGDEPLANPAAIDAVVSALKEDAEAQIATPCSVIKKLDEIMDFNVVKVVLDFEENALYFSRAPIPWVRDTGTKVAARHSKHVGIYACRRDALIDFATLPPGELERVEQLEQLRWLENGYKIRVVEVDYESVSVDVPADVAKVEAILRERGEA
jgi:3-deoxy-manno-octulosonate cytidylyltransferase (CMP-KDO synthetase)